MAPSKRSFAIRGISDGEPLRRVHLQSQVLDGIFDNDQQVFTNPFKDAELPSDKLTFRDLYTNTLYRSSKATRILKESMRDSPQFATDFAKLSLCTNVGRITTSMSFFPGKKTAIRSYHPVPSLQTTNGNLQDAPRIRHILKGCSVLNENVPLTTLPEVISRRDSGEVPPTNVPNLIFILASPSQPRTPADPVQFCDLLTPCNYSSSSRAQLFLWLCFYYLELPSIEDNPFSTQDGIPSLVSLTPEEVALENVDTAEDEDVLARLLAQRNDEVQAQLDKSAAKASAGDDPSPNGTKKSGGQKGTKGKKEFLSPPNDLSSQVVDKTVPRLHSPSSAKQEPPLSPIVLFTSPRYAPYPRVSTPILKSLGGGRYSLRPTSPSQASMLRYAWRTVSTTDALVDSDDESGDDLREEYIQRYQIINRLHPEPPLCP